MRLKAGATLMFTKLDSHVNNKKARQALLSQPPIPPRVNFYGALTFIAFPILNFEQARFDRM